MIIEKIRFLAEKNIIGIPNIIYIKGVDFEDVVYTYEKFCLELNIEGKILSINNSEAYLSYEREHIGSLILNGIINNEKDVKERAREAIKNDWRYPIIKQLNENNIPSIELEDNSIQIGYGKNSIRLKEDQYSEKDLYKIINKLRNGGVIPIICVTGTNGKTSTTRLIHNTLLELGYKSGSSTTGGIYIGNESIRVGDTTGYYSALEVLSRSDVNIAVLETARGGIIKKGLGFKNAKVGIITSLSEDHMGLEGINSIEQLGKIKAVIKEGLSNDGVMVIRATKDIVNLFNSDDNIILFDNKKNTIIEKYIEMGKEALYTKDGFIIQNIRGREEKIISLNDIDFTHNGLSMSNTRNVMSAIAAIKQIHGNMNEIVNAIKRIKCDLSNNRGRQNIIDIKEFKLIIDYGHNSEAFLEVFNIAKELNPTLITGLITAPGDRTDKYIIELGEIAASYCDKVIIKEQEDKRGRKKGETAALLLKGLRNKGFKEENITVLLKEEDAIDKALKDGVKGEVIVSFSQFLHITIPAINKYLKENGLECLK